MSRVLLRLNPVRLCSLYKILYPGRIESYSIMRTIVSPNKILLISHMSYSLNS